VRSPVAHLASRLDCAAQRAGVLAALAFAASALRCAARDGHLGWDGTTRASRLHLVVGNARFLILPHVRLPHLASAAFGAVTRRRPGE